MNSFSMIKNSIQKSALGICMISFAFSGVFVSSFLGAQEENTFLEETPLIPNEEQANTEESENYSNSRTGSFSPVVVGTSSMALLLATYSALVAVHNHERRALTLQLVIKDLDQLNREYIKGINFDNSLQMSDEELKALNQTKLGEPLPSELQKKIAKRGILVASMENLRTLEHETLNSAKRLKSFAMISGAGSLIGVVLLGWVSLPEEENIPEKNNKDSETSFYQP